MQENAPSFNDEFSRGNYARKIRDSFNIYNITSWWVSASAKTPDIFIQPREYTERIWEAFPTISRISVQINGEGKPSFGVSGYNHFMVEETRRKFEEMGYTHKIHTDKRGKRGRWWLTKTLDSLDSVAGEFKSIEPLLYEK